MNYMSTKPTIGDFVTCNGLKDSWMIQDIVFNHELNCRQARISKVGDPKVCKMVSPDDLTRIPKW